MNADENYSKSNPLSLEDLLDLAIAQELEVSLEEYCFFINRITYSRAKIIISTILSGDNKKIRKARLLFKKIVTNKNDIK
jgi:hypothetical protein